MKKSALAIYEFLQTKELLRDSPALWWPNAGTFEVVISALLTQNTTWSNVEKSLKNLEGFLDLECFVALDENSLKERIKPSGFYNQKAPRLLQLAKNIQEHFKTFENFQKDVSRKWLLEQKGIGKESADVILCYACGRDAMVVDSYTKRLLQSFGIEFNNYEAYQLFLEKELRQHYSQEALPKIFALFHGMIVECNKKKCF
ncbi:MAG: 3-methyladenine DNA glycosylase [Epsilonproteobacteria bacterium]|nr:3-methyladenine DNA glycosylase [Campylobacterota bacterium]